MTEWCPIRYMLDIPLADPIANCVIVSSIDRPRWCVRGEECVVGLFPLRRGRGLVCVGACTCCSGRVVEHTPPSFQGCQGLSRETSVAPAFGEGRGGGGGGLFLSFDTYDVVLREGGVGRLIRS